MKRVLRFFRALFAPMVEEQWVPLPNARKSPKQTSETSRQDTSLSRPAGTKEGR